MTYYDEIAKGYDELHKEEQVKKIKEILKHVKVKSTDKILDVGCGPCYLAEFIECSYVGIDPSVKLLELAKKKLKNRLNTKLMIGKGESLPFADKSFDIVFCITALHNFDDIQKSLDEMKRVGKRIVVSVLKDSKHTDEIRKKIKGKEVDVGVDVLFI